MAKTHSHFVCQQCGYAQVGWAGKCPECGSWGSLVETLVSTKSSAGRTSSKSSTGKEVSKPQFLASVPSRKTTRISTKIPELDRVLGGGLVRGQTVLIAGEPGIGKFTILLQVAEKLGDVLYVSGEESVSQIKIRADRLKVKKKSIQVMDETDVDSIIESVKSMSTLPKALVIDSIQVMSTGDLRGMAGSVGQVRECAYRLVRLAKSYNLPIFVVGHVTKEGTVAGPAVLAHIVDTLLWFEGDKSLTFRLLRAVKNRFGPTDEVGIFSMKEEGLISVSDPAQLFVSRGTRRVAGSTVTSIMQGTRPILVEIQALVVPTKLAFPKRIAQGIDSRRFELLLAVLSRRCGLPLYEFDCFLNVAGGIFLKGDPSADLAICLSVASAYFDKPLDKKLVAIGEVGLLAEIREVVGQEKRVKEAKRLGFQRVVTKKEVQYLQQAIKKYLSTRD